MLKTNSKKALENIRAYILNNYTPEAYNLPETSDFRTAAKEIYRCFYTEKHDNAEWGRVPEADIFADWCGGLPTVLDTCYYYNRSAVDDLGLILEETETEKARYNESDAEKLLTSLIYREIKKAIKI